MRAYHPDIPIRCCVRCSARILWTAAPEQRLCPECLRVFELVDGFYEYGLPEESA